MEFYIKTKYEALTEIKHDYLFVDTMFHPSRAHRKFQNIIKGFKDVKKWWWGGMNNSMMMTSRFDVNPVWPPDMI